MKAFSPLVLAASLAAAGTCAAFAADTVPLDRPQGDVRLDRDRGDVKAGKRSAEVKPHQNTKTAKKPKKRSTPDLPGTLVSH